MTHEDRSTRGIRGDASHRHVSETRPRSDQDSGHADVSRTGQEAGRCACELRRWLCGARLMAVSVHDANSVQRWFLQLSDCCRDMGGGSSDR